MAAVKVAEFISSSASYVRASVGLANTNKNAYLTKTEAAKLPKDLRDNSEAHRVGAQGNASARADKFEERYTSYVAVMAKRADKNNNGTLSAAEAKNLPADLQDNYWNYRYAMDAQG